MSSPSANEFVSAARVGNIEGGQDVNVRDRDGETALIEASKNGHTDIVNQLLSRGATVDLKNNGSFPQEAGQTALFLASRSGYTDIVSKLLSGGATVDLANREGETALIQASNNGHTDIVNQLLSRGATVDRTNNAGQTALFLASRRGHTDVVSKLLSGGATVDLANRDGETPLIEASNNGRTDIVNQLLSRGATMDRTNKYGQTALFLASRRGHTDIVKLLSGGATVDLTNNLKSSTEDELMRLEVRKSELQQKLQGATSDGERKQLENELTTTEKEIAQTVSIIERRVEAEEKLKEQKRKEESKRHLDKAMEEGYMLLRIINMLLVGVAGGGKTSTKDLVMNKSPREDRNSTPVLDRTVHVRPVQHTQYQSTSSNEWKEVSRQEQIHLLAQAIQSLPENFHDNLPDDLQKRLKKRSTTSDHPRPFHREGPKADVKGAPTLQSQSPVEAAISAVTDLVLEAMLSAESIVKPSATTHTGREDSELYGSTMIRVTDSGGQPQFQDTASLFTRRTASGVVVSRLTDDFQSFPHDEYYKDGKLVGIPSSSHITHGDTIMSLIRSLLSHSKKEKPSLVFVGTFLDQLKDPSKVIAAKNEALLEMLPPEIKENVVFSDRRLDRLIFAVNALSRDADTLAIAQEIRKAVEASPSYEIKVPNWWHFIELVLQELSSILKRGVLSRDECVALAQRLGFHPDALDAALDYFDDVCIAHYYPKILPNTVFVDPQVPLDKVSELTQYAISLRDAKEDKSTSRTVVAMPAKWKRFRDEGILTLEFLQSEQFQQHYQEGLFMPPDLIAIMRELLVIAPLSISELGEVDCPLSEAEFFMPTLLRSLPPSEVEERRVLDSPAAPLLIRFPSGSIRCGVFCCLVVYLMKKCRWQVCLPSGEPVLLAKNCVKFRFPGCPCRVTLIDSFSQIEVYVKALSQICAKACPVIHKNLLDGVESACQALHYNNDHPVTSIFCPHKDGTTPTCTSPKRHYAEVYSDDGCWCCSKDIDLVGGLDRRHSVWFGDSSISSTHDAIDVPELTQSNLLIKLDVLDRPMELGARLGIEQIVRNNIEKKYSHPVDISKQKYDLFGYIERNSKFLGITWDRIADVLLEMGYGDLSMTIRDM